MIVTDSDDLDVNDRSFIPGTPEPHVHHQLVLDERRCKLCTFSCTRELVQAIHDALIGRLVLTLVSRDVGHDF